MKVQILFTMNFISVIILAALPFLSAESLSAQFISARVQVNGLTCSLCSAGIENALYKLPFVSKVQMDLNQNVADITFHSKGVVKLDELSRQVLDAGFSIEELKAQYRFKHYNVTEGATFESGGETYTFVKVRETLLEGAAFVQLVSKESLSRKRFKEYEPSLIPFQKRRDLPLNNHFVTL